MTVKRGRSRRGASRFSNRMNSPWPSPASKVVRRRLCYVAAIPPMWRPPRHRLGHRQRQIAPRLGQDHCDRYDKAGRFPTRVLDAECTWRRSRCPVHRREGGERSPALIGRGADTDADGKTQRAAVSFATSKLSSISTLLGSVTKICRRELFGHFVDAKRHAFGVRCCLMASKPRCQRRCGR